MNVGKTLFAQIMEFVPWTDREYQQIGVGVEIFGKLVALVTQITFDFELDAIAILQLFKPLRATKLGGHVIVGQIGDVTDLCAPHAGRVAAPHRVRNNGRRENRDRSKWPGGPGR